MKLIKYTLNADGTIPEYIVDGGYFASPNNGVPPKDLDIVGIANEDAPQTGFASEAELLTYVQGKNFIFKDTITQEITPIETVVSTIWSKLG